MLVAFMLLLLLAFWRQQEQADSDLISRLSRVDREALSEGAVPVRTERLAELEGLERLAADPKLRLLADASSELSHDEVRLLADLVRNPESVQAMRDITEGAVPVRTERLAELEGLERLAADPDRLSRADAAPSLSTDEVRRLFNKKLRRELSAPVEQAGGQIGPRGRITFPDRAFFDAGSYEITERSRQFLDNVCYGWLATLKELKDRFDIDEIRIEGHSSSEWEGAATEWDAWVKNLELSQRRAEAVLVHCLEYVGETPLRDWAKEKLTAVGYSSSKPLLTAEGGEDRKASRRVVLGYEVSREGLTDDEDGPGR